MAWCAGPRPGAGSRRSRRLRDHALVEPRPERVLADPGPQAVDHARDRALDARERGANAGDLLGQLDRPGALDRGLGVGQLEPLGGECGRGRMVDPLDRHPPAAAAMPAHQIADLGGPRLGPLVGARTRGRERHRGRRAYLVDRLEPLGQMMAAGKLEQDHRALGRHEQIARRVAQMEHLHVAGAGGVADVDRIEEHASRQIAPSELLAHPLQTAQAQAPLVHRSGAGCLVCRRRAHAQVSLASVAFNR